MSFEKILIHLLTCDFQTNSPLYPLYTRHKKILKFKSQQKFSLSCSVFLDVLSAINIYQRIVSHSVKTNAKVCPKSSVTEDLETYSEEKQALPTRVQNNMHVESRQISISINILIENMFF